jgi:hypothetical protein
MDKSQIFRENMKRDSQVMANNVFKTETTVFAQDVLVCRFEHFKELQGMVKLINTDPPASLALLNNGQLQL